MSKIITLTPEQVKAHPLIRKNEKKLEKLQRQLAHKEKKVKITTKQRKR